MFKNYFITAWRNLLKGRVFNAINIIGLATAISCAVLLFLAVDFEFSFDRFHKNVNDIYQVYFTRNNANEKRKDTPMPAPITPALKSEYAAVQYISRLGNGGGLVRYKNKEISQSLNFADEDFSKIFNLKTLQGESKTMLHDLHSIVLNEQVAKALFNNETPIGKIIGINYSGEAFENFTVTAVIKDMPRNSSLQFDMITRFENYRDYQKNIDKWDVGNHSVFVRLQPGTDAKGFEKKLIPFTNKFFKTDIENLMRDGGTRDADGQFFTINLLPFAGIHLNTEISGLDGNSINKIYVYALLVIGIFVLLIACINFINLNIARAFNRAREIGVRKTLGANKKQLLLQFCVETILICFVALVLGLLLASLLLPGFKTMFGSYISLKVLLQPAKFLSATGLFLLISCVAGFYPAWLMLRYKTLLVLKGNVNTAKPGMVRNILLVTQFGLSSLLIVCTLVTWQQMRYMKNKPLGFNRTEVISIPLPGNVMIENQGGSVYVPGQRALELIRNKLQNQPGIVGITAAHGNIGLGKDGSTSTQTVGFNYNGHELISNLLKVEYDYLKTLDIKLLEGRDFSRAFATDTNAVIVNEQMARQIGGKTIVGTFLPVNDDSPPMQVVGIIKDYNFRSLRENIEPLMIALNKNEPVNYIFIRTKSASLLQSFDQIKATWKSLFPNAEFKGSWLSENTERLYRNEKNLNNIFISGAIVAISISCIGLLAMAMMVIVQRTKEIGIRKVLGASVGGIVTLLSVDFLKLVLLACILSFPIAWYAMNNWLQHFAYRITISWWMFAIAAVLAIMIALITISFQAIKAAIVNPVKSLRTE